MLELLRNHVEEMESLEDFDKFPELCSSKNVLSNHWVVKFVNVISAMLMLIYICAKREHFPFSCMFVTKWCHIYL